MAKNRKTRVLLYYQQYSTFVREDYNILSGAFKVTKYKFTPFKESYKFFFEILKSFFFSIIHIPKNDIVYLWFADYHSFFPALTGWIFRKKVVIVVGGYDAVALPKYNYGIFQKKGMRAFCAKLSFKLANFIIPVDESLIEGENTYIDKNGIKKGVKHFVKNLNAEFFVIPTAYDKDKWKNDGIPKRNSIITVASILDSRTVVLKGIDLFIEISKHFSSVDFIIVGVHRNMFAELNKIIGNNVKLIGFATPVELVKYYSGSKVFCQLSISEGLPNTLCEAMLCECIPVGSNVGGIPKAIGEHGFILKNQDINEAKKIIEEALNAPEKMGRDARQHIINNFGIERRKKALINLLS